MHKQEDQLSIIQLNDSLLDLIGAEVEEEKNCHTPSRWAWPERRQEGTALSQENFVQENR